MKPPAMQEITVRFLRKIRWRRERLPTPVLLGFPGGSAGKESACNAEDPWVGKMPWRRKRQPTLVLWPGEFHGLYTVLGVTKSQTQLSNFYSLTHNIIILIVIVVIF